MIYTTRKQAAFAGSLTYNTGKPCSNNHLDADGLPVDRYTSCGACTGCLKMQAETYKQARDDRNTKRFSGLQPKEIWVKKKYHDSLTDYAHILRYGTESQIEVVQSFILTIKEGVK